MTHSKWSQFTWKMVSVCQAEGKDPTATSQNKSIEDVPSTEQLNQFP